MPLQPRAWRTHSFFPCSTGHCTSHQNDQGFSSMCLSALESSLSRYSQLGILLRVSEVYSVLVTVSSELVLARCPSLEVRVTQSVGTPVVSRPLSSKRIPQSACCISCSIQRNEIFDKATGAESTTLPPPTSAQRSASRRKPRYGRNIPQCPPGNHISFTRGLGLFLDTSCSDGPVTSLEGFQSLTPNRARVSSREMAWRNVLMTLYEASGILLGTNIPMLATVSLDIG